MEEVNIKIIKEVAEVNKITLEEELDKATITQMMEEKDKKIMILQKEEVSLIHKATKKKEIMYGNKKIM
jgi:hypothetical protein